MADAVVVPRSPLVTPLRVVVPSAPTCAPTDASPCSPSAFAPGPDVVPFEPPPDAEVVELLPPDDVPGVPPVEPVDDVDDETRVLVDVLGAAVVEVLPLAAVVGVVLGGGGAVVGGAADTVKV